MPPNDKKEQQTGLQPQHNTGEKLSLVAEQPMEPSTEDKWPAVEGTELAAILAESALPAATEEEEAPLHRVDISKLHSDVLGSIEIDNYAKTAVDDAVHTLLTEIRKFHTANIRLLERLKTKDQRIKFLVDSYNSDPRVGKVLKVAMFWREESEKHQQTTKELWQQLEHLQMDLESSTQAIQNNKNIIGRLTKENRACQDDRTLWDSLQNKFSQQTTQLTECVEKSKEFKEQLTELQEKLASNNDAMNQLMKTARSASDCEVKMHHLEDCYNRLRGKYDEIVFKSRQTEKRSETHLAQLDLMTHNMLVLQNKNRSIEKYVSTLKSQLAKSHNVLDSRKEYGEYLNKEIDRQLMDLKNVHKKLHSKECELQVAKITISSLKNFIQSQETKLHQSNKDIQECNLKNRTTALELDVHKRENAKLQTTHGNLMTKIGTMDRYLKNKDEYIRIVNSEVGNARHKAIILLNNVEDVVAESVRLQQKNAVLYQFGIDMKSRWIQYNEKNEEQKKIICERDSKIMDMLVQIKKLGISYSRLNETLFKAQNRNHIMQADARRQMEDMRSLQRTLHFSAAEVKTFCDKFETSTKEIQKLQLADVRNVARINNLESECNAQKEKIRQMVTSLREERNHLEYFMKEVNHMSDLLKYENIRCNEFQQQRDIMGARVVAGRAREQLLQERSRVMEQVIHHGKRACEESNNDIVILKKEVLNQRRELKNLQTVLDDNKNMKDELIKCKKDLILEENKRSAVSSLINPRLHPNRLLKAIFPSKYEMLLKNQKLVRCFIKKVDENINKEKEVISLKKDLMSMRTLLEAHAAFQKPQDIVTSRADIRTKDRRIKSLMAELNCATDALRQARATTDRVTSEFMTFKAKVNEGVYLPRSLSRPRPVSSLPPIEPNKDCHLKNQKGGGFVMYDTPKSKGKPGPCVEQSSPPSAAKQNIVFKDSNRNASIAPVKEDDSEVGRKKRVPLPKLITNTDKRNVYRKTTSLSSAERMMKTAAKNRNSSNKNVNRFGKAISRNEKGKTQGLSVENRETIAVDKNNGNICPLFSESNRLIAFDEMYDNLEYITEPSVSNVTEASCLDLNDEKVSFSQRNETARLGNFKDFEKDNDNEVVSASIDKNNYSKSKDNQIGKSKKDNNDCKRKVTNDDEQSNDKDSGRNRIINRICRVVNIKNHVYSLFTRLLKIACTTKK